MRRQAISSLCERVLTQSQIVQYSLLHTQAIWYGLLLLGYKTVQHVTVVNTVDNCNTMVSITSSSNSASTTTTTTTTATTATTTTNNNKTTTTTTTTTNTTVTTTTTTTTATNIKNNNNNNKTTTNTTTTATTKRAPEPVYTGTENLAPTRTRSPDRPALSKSLYRLSYPGP